MTVTTTALIRLQKMCDECWATTARKDISLPPSIRFHILSRSRESLSSLTEVAFQHCTINGQQMTMGAGGQIRVIDNMIILPSTANYIGLIRLQLDTMGNLHRVWILMPDEVKEAESEGQQIPKPKKRFFFF